MRALTGSYVIPVIFASSVVMVPTTIGGIFQSQEWLQELARYLGFGQPLHYVLYVTAIIFFSYFYVSITFNPVEVADNMKKYGGFIPGIRAGRPTAEYLNYVLTRITVPGAIYLALVSLIPLIVPSVCTVISTPRMLDRQFSSGV